MIFSPKIQGLTVALSLLLSISGYAQQAKAPKGISFSGSDLNSVLTIAKQQHKPVFVDAYAVWCAPCQQLKKETFRDKALTAYFNSHFISTSIDVEKGDGERFAEQYNVNSYPTLLFIDENGRIIKRIEGFADAKLLLATAKTIK